MSWDQIASRICPSPWGRKTSACIWSISRAYMDFSVSIMKKNGPCAPHHNPAFDVDESVLPSGTAIYVGFAVQHLHSTDRILV